MDIEFLPADRFVDPKNRMYPIQSQQDCDRAARALPALTDQGRDCLEMRDRCIEAGALGGNVSFNAIVREAAPLKEFRARLARLAREGGWLLPTSFVDEVEALNAADGRYALFGAAPPLTRERADLHALTPTGVDLLRQRGLKPSEPGSESRVATFNATKKSFPGRQAQGRPGRQPRPADRGQRLHGPGDRLPSYRAVGAHQGRIFDDAQGRIHLSPPGSRSERLTSKIHRPVSS